MFVLLLVTVLLAVGFVLWPFVRQAVPAFPGRASTSDTEEELRWQQMALYETIRELDFAYEAGQYTEEDYQRQRMHTDCGASLPPGLYLGDRGRQAEPEKIVV